MVLGIADDGYLSSVGEHGLSFGDGLQAVVRTLRVDVRLEVAEEPVDRGLVKDVDGVHAGEARDDLGALVLGEDRAIGPLRPAHGLIPVHRDHEVVSKRPRMAQRSHVADMEDVEAAVREDDPLRGALQVLHAPAEPVEVAQYLLGDPVGGRHPLRLRHGAASSLRPAPLPIQKGSPEWDNRLTGAIPGHMRAIPKRYRILKKLGRGGEGSVWLAADRLHGDAPVALKWIRPDAVPDDALEGLGREFLTLSRLAHPHIARVRDFGLLPGGEGAWFTSEYVAGGNLLEWALAPAPEERWRGLTMLALQALSVLRYLSLRGLRHGDVKPANLLVGEERGQETLKVIDFGAARLAEAVGVRFFGTRAYLPPPDSPADPDLYALGMSLYHAGVGRLPFALGDDDALSEWWSVGEPARARAADPGAPPAMDELIAGLTATQGGSRFRSAAEAIEWLRGKVALPPAPRPILARSIAVSGREGFLDELERECAAGRGKGGIIVISGPRGLGKGAVLEALAARLQCRGSATAVFQGLDDGDALRAVASIVESPQNGAPGGLDAGSLAGALRGAGSALAILIHDEPDAPEPSREGPAFRFISEAVRLAASGESEDSLPLIAVATEDPARLAGRLGAPETAFRIHALEPLSREAIRGIAREFFAVEAIPEEITTRIESESGGSPAEVQEALETLASAGVAAGLLGELKLPPRLPDRIVSDAAGPRTASTLPPDLRSALGLVALAGESIDAAGASFRFPIWSEEEWRALLESLRTRGFLHLAGRGAAPSYRRSPAGAAATPEDLLGAAAEREARRALGMRLAALETPSPGALLASAQNLSALGDASGAARAALRAVREAMRSVDPRGRFDREALDALRALAGEVARGPRDRERWALRLSAAGFLRRIGELDAAMELLRAAGAPPAWYRGPGDLLRADVHEARGEIDAGVAALEGLLEQGGMGSGAGTEAEARLASLYFRAGKQHRGKDLLERGRRFLEDLRRSPARAGGARAARVLGLFARAETAHGEPAAALEMLEEALRLARTAGRDDLAATPLHELGVLYAQEGRWEDALRAFEEIEASARARQDLMGALKAIHNRAIIHYWHHDLDRAEALFREARRLSGEIGRHGLEAAILLGAASVLRERGRLLEALRLYRRITGGRIRASASDRAVAHGNMREIYLVLGRLDRSLHHATRAFRLAMGVKSRYLEAMTHRFRGVIHAALGRLGPAREDLERALALARAEGDVRGEGAASHHLGMLAAVEGRADDALRLLRRGIVASRSAGDLRHLHAGIVAALSELARRGRTRAARRILLGGGAPSSWVRADLAALVLSLRVGDRWPSSAGEAAAAARDAAAQGRRWEAFRAITDALLDPALDAAGRSELVLVRDALAAMVLVSVPRRHVSAFRTVWGLPAAGKRGGAPEGERAAPSRAPTSSSESLLAFLKRQPRSVRTLAEDILEAAGARSLWILTDAGGGIGSGETIAVGGGEGLGRFLEEHARAVHRAAPGTFLARDEFLCIALPDPARRVMIVARAPDGGFADIDVARRALAERASVLSLAFRLIEAEARLAGVEDRRSGAETEVRRMNAMAVKEFEKLETAFLDQKVEIFDLRRRLEEADDSPSRPDRAPVGNSPALRDVISRLPRLAALEVPVLVLGESGVGKDLVARWIHELSPRRERPFAAESCTIPESLVEAELFGFVKGAFTDALKDRPGLFQRIEGGTLYLDEIGELSLSMQARLLRVLEERRVRPLGSEASIPVDFRLLSSSRRTAAELQSETRLRRDFFYRVNAEVITIPPLRERKEDIRPVVLVALEEHARREGTPAPHVTDAAWRKLEAHDWPGNIRELLNEVERALVARPVEITPDLLFARGAMAEGRAATRATERIPPLREGRLQVERDLVLRALGVHGGNVSRAARALRVTRRYLTTLIQKHGIRIEDHRERASEE